VGWKDVKLNKKGLPQLEVDLAHELQHRRDLDDPNVSGQPISVAEQRAMGAEIPVLMAQRKFAEARRLMAVVKDPARVIEEYKRRQARDIPDSSLRDEYVNWYLNQPFGRDMDNEKDWEFQTRIWRSQWDAQDKQ